MQLHQVISGNSGWIAGCPRCCPRVLRAGRPRKSSRRQISKTILSNAPSSWFPAPLGDCLTHTNRASELPCPGLQSVVSRRSKRYNQDIYYTAMETRSRKRSRLEAFEEDFDQLQVTKSTHVEQGKHIQLMLLHRLQYLKVSPVMEPLSKCQRLSSRVLSAHRLSSRQVYSVPSHSVL